MKTRIFALVDCNNFYVSCQRAFSASLQNRGVIVLSNNDGCVIARSNEVKGLIKMGQPFFECRELVEQQDISVFSSNYSLYADMSDRVMTLLATFAPRREIYSIDEAFLDLTDLSIPDLTAFGRQIKRTVYQFTSLPVSIGIATSKTLAKLAHEIAKKYAAYAGVLDLTALSEHEVDELLEVLPVDDVGALGCNMRNGYASGGYLPSKN